MSPTHVTPHDRRAAGGPRNLTSGSDYHFDVSDPFTPTPAQAPLLKDNMNNGQGLFHDPLSYVTWFDQIWHLGDPSRWGPEVFTTDSVMIDSAGRSTGAQIAASDFLLLFKYFPALRGEVVSWAHNDTEILINWRFVVAEGKNVPVIDKFSFVDGLVSFREAYFDTLALISYLAEVHGSAPVIDYLRERLFEMNTGLGIVFMPSLIKAFVKGLFLWSEIPLDAPTGLKAVSSANQIALSWNPVEGAKSYTVKRSLNSNGPFGWISYDQPGITFVDEKVQPGKDYYYVVAANATGMNG
jgi:hypothetical protein